MLSKYRMYVGIIILNCGTFIHLKKKLNLRKHANESALTQLGQQYLTKRKAVQCDNAVIGK